METNKLVVLAIAGFIFYNGYQKQSTTPVPGPVDNKVVIDHAEYIWPKAPTDAQATKLLSGLDSVGITASDALVLATAYQQFAYVVANDEDIADLNQLARLHAGAANQLIDFQRSIEGKYKGGYGTAIDNVTKALYNHHLAYLIKDGKVSTTSIGPVGSPTRKALEEWLNNLSWKFSTLMVEANKNEHS